MEKSELEQPQISKQDISLACSKMNEGYWLLIDTLKDYLDTTEENYKTIALWIIGTYFHEKFNTFPYLFFNAMRGSGKTRALKLISALSNGGDGSVQNNLTEAVLFRIQRNVTTCIDEIEQIGSKEKQTLRELLNSAYKKGMKVKRMRKSFSKEGEKQVTEVFEPYFPIAMANIYGVEEVLGDRSIVLVLEKSNNPFINMKIEDFDRNYTISLLKRTFGEFSVVSVMKLLEKDYIGGWNGYINERYKHTTTYNTYTSLTTLTTLGIPQYKKMEMDEFFNKIHDLKIVGRNFELLFPLLITANLLGDDVFNDFCKIANKIVERKIEEEYTNSKDVSLYEFIDSMENYGNSYISIKELTNRFRTYMGESDEEDKWLNDKWLGRALKRLNLTIDKRRMPSGIQVTLNYIKAKDKLKIFQTEGNHGKDN